MSDVVLRFDPRFRCKALTTTTGERCKRPAHPGAQVCVKHGAGAPQIKAKAKQRLAEQRIQHELGQLMHDLEGETLSDSHPLEVLCDVVARANAMVQVLGVLVGELKPEQGNWERPGRLMGLNHLGDGAPHIAAQMYLDWLKEAGRLSKLALDAGVEERRTRVSEEQAEFWGRFIRGVLVEAGVWSRPDMPAIVHRHMELLVQSSGGPSA